MTNVFEFSTFDLARCQRQTRMLALQGLYTGQLIGTQRPFTLRCQGWRLLIQRVDVLDLLRQLLIRLRRQPVPDQVGFEIPLFSSRAA